MANRPATAIDQRPFHRSVPSTEFGGICGPKFVCPHKCRIARHRAIPDAAYITGVVLPVDGGTTVSVGTRRPIGDS